MGFLTVLKVFKKVTMVLSNLEITLPFIGCTRDYKSYMVVLCFLDAPQNF